MLKICFVLISIYVSFILPIMLYIFQISTQLMLVLYGNLGNIRGSDVVNAEADVERCETIKSVDISYDHNQDKIFEELSYAIENCDNVYITPTVSDPKCASMKTCNRIFMWYYDKYFPGASVIDRDHFIKYSFITRVLPKEGTNKGIVLLEYDGSPIISEEDIGVFNDELIATYLKTKGNEDESVLGNLNSQEEQSSENDVSDSILEEYEFKTVFLNKPFNLNIYDLTPEIVNKVELIFALVLRNVENEISYYCLQQNIALKDITMDKIIKLLFDFLPIYIYAIEIKSYVLWKCVPDSNTINFMLKDIKKFVALFEMYYDDNMKPYFYLQFEF